MKEIIYTNETKASSEIWYAEEKMKMLSKTCALFNSLEIGELNSIDEFLSFCRTPKQFCDNLISESVGKETEIGALKINKSKLLTLATPENYEAVIDSVERLNISDRSIEWRFYEIEDSKIKLLEGYKELILQENSTYVESETQEKFVAEVQNLYGLIKDLNSKYSASLGKIRITWDGIFGEVTNPNGDLKYGDTVINKSAFASSVKRVK
jgi:hypothetical protein